MPVSYCKSVYSIRTVISFTVIQYIYSVSTVFSFTVQVPYF